MAASTVWIKFRSFTRRHPIVRGVLSYSIFWPTASAVQQVFEGNTLENFDWKRCVRFGIYGGLYVAPTLYGWIRLTSYMWPTTSLRTALLKAFTEQLSYGPFALSSFYIGMTLLEFKSFNEGVEELKAKFLPTWKVGICFWPIVQTINFSVVPEHNRVVVISIFSFMWTTFLAYMKHLEREKASSEEDTAL